MQILACPQAIFDIASVYVVSLYTYILPFNSQLYTTIMQGPPSYIIVYNIS